MQLDGDDSRRPQRNKRKLRKPLKVEGDWDYWREADWDGASNAPLNRLDSSMAPRLGVASGDEPRRRFDTV